MDLFGLFDKYKDIIAVITVIAILLYIAEGISCF